jgi:hypothetical protein
MASKEIQISSVKLINGGLKGLEIKYLELNDVNSNIYKSEITKKSRRPVNIDMQLKFEEFKDHLAELCSIDEGKLAITGITAGHDKFLISGTVEVLDKKKSAINTPCIKEEDGYDKYDVVQEKVDSIYKMVLEYMEKEAYTATNEQMILQFNKGKEGFDAEAVKNMTEEEQVIEATKLLEKIGCVVMNPHEEDMPGGIDAKDDFELEDISAGDEKQDMFAEKIGVVSQKDLVHPEDFNISVGDEKEELFTEEPKKDGKFTLTMRDPEEKSSVFVGEIKSEGFIDTQDETTTTTTIDIGKATKEDADKLIEASKIAEKKQKAQEQLAKLKASQKKVEQAVDEDDDFIPMRKVM